MSTRETLISTQGSVTPVINRIDKFIREHLAAGVIYLTLSRESLLSVRNGAQNRLMWPLLTDFSQQVTHLDDKKYSPDDWKDLLTAGFEKATRFAPNLDGSGIICFGVRTSKFSKKKMSQFIEFVYSEGCERGVIWSDGSNDVISEVRA
jgi:hypothetical protein